MASIGKNRVDPIAENRRASTAEKMVVPTFGKRRASQQTVNSVEIREDGGFQAYVLITYSLHTL